MNDGGPAFATSAVMGSHSVCHQGQSGMSLRDYFAGQALAGMMACAERQYFEAKTSTLAEWSYQAADAMLLARSK